MMIASGWSGSPYTDVVAPGSYGYYVVAVNTVGSTPSNTATGTSQP